MPDHCGECHMRGRVKHRNFAGSGEPGGLLVIADAPSDLDDKTGRPFSDPSGRIAQRLIDASVQRLKENTGYKLPVRYEYAVGCSPGKHYVNNYIDNCQWNLRNKIKRAKPTRILTFGTVAQWAVSGEALPLMNVVGGWTHVDGVPVQFCISPAAVLHNKSLRKFWEKTTKRAILQAPPHSWDGPDDVSVRRVKGKRAVAILDKACKQRVVAFDTEYNNVTNRLLCYAISWEANKAYVFDHKVVQSYRVQKALKRLFKSRAIMVAHNWKFDARVMVASQDFEPELFTADKYWWDTSSMRKLYNPEQESKLDIAGWMVGMGGHKDQLKAILGRSAKGPAYEKAYNEHSKIVRRYCGMDAIACFRLAILYENLLKSEGLWDAWEECMGPIGPALFSMEHTGIRIGREKIEAARKKLQAKIEIILRAIQADRNVQRVINSGLMPVPKNYPKDQPIVFNPGSTAMMREVLFGKKGLKLKPLKKTGKGAASTDAETMDILMRSKSSPLLKHIGEYRRLSKLKGTYVDGIYKRVDSNFFIHTTYRQDVARTGRLSSQDPNLQNIPRPETEEARMIRRLLLPLHEDECFLEVDHSQIEIRIAADISGDPEMMSAFLHKKDIHRITASVMLGIKAKDVTKEQRQKAKAVNFGLLYGMSPQGLVDYALNDYGVVLTLAEAKAYRRAFFKTYRVYRTWQIKLLSKARRDGFVNSYWLGNVCRRRWVYDLGSDHGGKRGHADRVVYNTPVQGGASEYTLRNMVVLHKLIRDGKLKYVTAMIGTVHDSIWFSVKKAHVKKAFMEIAKVMVSFPTNGVPLEVEGKAGPSLGDLKEIGTLNSLDLKKAA